METPLLHRVRLLLPLLFTALLAPSAFGECKVADEALAIASSIRQLKVKRSVPCNLTSADEVESFLRKTFDENVPRERLQFDETTSKLLGLVPRDYDYFEGMIELYRDQIGGFYDPKTHQYSMAAWMPEAMQMNIAVHELTHALQDQHFDLDRFVDEERMTTDEQLARSALVEGDATAVMLDFTRKLMGQGPLSGEREVSGFMAQTILGSTLSPSIRRVPSSLQALLIFPYVSGLHYVHTLMRDGGYDAVSRKFQAPVRTTHEILHPDTSFVAAKIEPVSARTEAGQAEREVGRDSLGEFVISTLLGSYLPSFEAVQVSGEWRGDLLQLFKDEDGKKRAVLQIILASSESAQRFHQSIDKALRKRFGGGLENEVYRSTLHIKGELVTLEVGEK